MSLSMARQKSNPIRKVIDLLATMKKEVDHEAQKEKDLYEKYMCFCNHGQDNLDKSIALAKVREPQIQSKLEEANSIQDRLEEELTQTKEDREEVKDRIIKAKALRETDGEAYKKAAVNMKAELTALAKAIKILEQKGEQSTFLQDGATALRQLVQSKKLVREARASIQAFLDSNSTTGAEGAGVDEVVGICKQLHVGLQKEADTADAKEMEDQDESDKLIEASENQKKALTSASESMIVRIGKLKVEIVDLAQDLESTGDASGSDKEFLADVSGACSTIKGTYAQHATMRSEELITLTSTIAVLNKDETLQLFRDKPSPGLLQMSMRSTSHSQTKRAVALRLLRATKTMRHRFSGQLNLIMLALQSRKNTKFVKIIKKIDEMIMVLGAEQKADYSKREHCMKDIRSTKSKLNAVVDDKVVKRIGNEEETVKTMTEDIGTLVESIKKQDLAMEDSKVQRAQNHEGFMEELMSNRAALEIIDLAKNKLVKFYHLRMKEYTPPRGESNRAKMNPNQFGPGAMAVMRGMTGVQEDSTVTEDGEDDDNGDVDRQQASQGVLSMLSQLAFEIRRDTVEAQTEEKNHKASFQAMRKDSLNERRVLSRTLERKEQVKANTIEGLHKLRGTLTQERKEERELKKYQVELHEGCDFLLKEYDSRKVARKHEEDALRRTSLVLSS